jgi:hypothetical protein
MDCWQAEETLKAVISIVEITAFLFVCGRIEDRTPEIPGKPVRIADRLV